MTHIDKEPRRFVKGRLTQTIARPALRDEVMAALHHRPEHERTRFIELADVQRILNPYDWGVWSALQALAEYDLVELFEPDHLFDRPARIMLTPTGHRWKHRVPGEPASPQTEPMRFAYQVNGVLACGTLADWAKAWEHGHYSGDTTLSDTLITWRNRQGYLAHVDPLSGPHGDEDGCIRYQVWAAGELEYVIIDGNA
jgi:hypothetical protein